MVNYSILLLGSLVPSTVAFNVVTNPARVGNKIQPHPSQQKESAVLLLAHSNLLSPYYSHYHPSTSSSVAGSNSHKKKKNHALFSEAGVLAALEEFTDRCESTTSALLLVAERQQDDTIRATEEEEQQEEDNDNIYNTVSPQEQERFQDLCRLLNVEAGNHNNRDELLIRLESNPSDGVRGVYLNRAVQRGDLLLKVPLEACLVDDEPPRWWTQAKEQQDNDNNNEDAYTCHSEWVPRIAASLLDLQLQQRQNTHTNIQNNNLLQGQYIWLSFLPNPDHLRASLPVHWSEDILSSARCTALELSVDSAYFARAQAVQELIDALQDHPAVRDMPREELSRWCHNALDVVQTRSCRSEPIIFDPTMMNQDDNTNRNNKDDDNEKNNDASLLGISLVGRPETESPPLRILAPVFDMINHGSSQSRVCDGCANAHFGIEQDNTNKSYLCVRATKDIEAHDEVLIDYGDSAKPAWKCLLSYGFVPRYTMPGVEDDDEDDDVVDENVAEVFMDGTRYEVGPSTIPFDMVAAAMVDNNNNGVLVEEEDVALTPDIALKLAKRISDVSYYLLLDDKSRQKQQQQQQQQQQNYNMEDNDEEDDDEITEEETVEDLISMQLAASLRWSHHRILSACAKGLQEWASR